MIAEDPRPRTIWRAEDGLRVTAIIALLTLVERAVLDLRVVRSLEGTALLAARSLAVAAFYAAIVGVLWLYARRAGVGLTEAVALRQEPSGQPGRAGRRWRAVRDALLAALVGVVFEIAFLTMLSRVGVQLGPTRDVVEFFGTTPLGVVALVSLGVVIGPVVEEMAFRGAVLPGLAERYGQRVGVWGSALLFAVIHLNASGIVPFALLGALLGWLRLRYSSLWPAVFGHVAFNAAVLGLTLVLRTA